MSFLRLRIEHGRDNESAHDEHERGIELEGHAAGTQVIKRRENPFEDQRPRERVRNGVRLCRVDVVDPARGFTQRDRQSEDNTVDDIAHITDDQIERHIDPGCSTIAKIVVVANIAISAVNHVSPVRNDELRRAGQEAERHNRSRIRECLLLVVKPMVHHLPPVLEPRPLPWHAAPGDIIRRRNGNTVTGLR